MFGYSWGPILIIMVIVLLLFGPKRLPDEVELKLRGEKDARLVGVAEAAAEAGRIVGAALAALDA